MVAVVRWFSLFNVSFVIIYQPDSMTHHLKIVPQIMYVLYPKHCKYPSIGILSVEVCLDNKEPWEFDHLPYGWKVIVYVDDVLVV